jgi:hypothetical protein
MDVRPDIQIQSMIKAMIDVVLPAVDPEHKMALEQARLVISTLQLVAKRLPIAYRYDVDELRRYVAFARDLVAEVGPDVGWPVMTELQTLAADGGDVLDRALAEPAEIESAIFELRLAVGKLVQEANQQGSSEARKTVRKLVLAASKVELGRERALVVDMGFETDLNDMPVPIEQQLPASPSARS